MYSAISERLQRIPAAPFLLLPFLAFVVVSVPRSFAVLPNLVIIHADDLGWADLGCYGSLHHRTPHLDQLAREGMLFTQAYSSAGRLIDAISAQGLADRTIVIFVSDNGGFLGADRERYTSNAPLREGKSTLYEGGIRVPLIVRWPGILAAGSRCDAPVTNLDFMTTWTTIAGVAPGDTDGTSLMPLLRGTGDFPPRSLYWHFPHYRRAMAGISASPASAVRHGDWKLIHFYEDDHVELYNLATDPGEARDLATVELARAAALRRQLDEWRRAVDAQPPQPNPAFSESKS